MKSKHLFSCNLTKTPSSSLLRFLPVCLLLRQLSAPASVREGPQRRRLHVTVCVPWPALRPSTPSGRSRSQDDAAADLSHVEVDKADQEERGGRRGCGLQVTNHSSPFTKSHRENQRFYTTTPRSCWRVAWWNSRSIYCSILIFGVICERFPTPGSWHASVPWKIIT